MISGYNKNNHYYNKKLKPFARNLRSGSTKAEIRLWCELLRFKQMLGKPFLRQRPIANFIADFMCKELGLIIEVDGITHDEKQAADKERDEALTALGFTTLRFTDDEVFNHIHSVRETIEDWILKNS